MTNLTLGLILLYNTRPRAMADRVREREDKMYVNFHPNKGQLTVKAQRLFDLECNNSTHIITFRSDGADITDQVTIFVKSLSEVQRLANLLNRSLIDLSAEAAEYERQQKEEGEHVRS